MPPTIKPSHHLTNPLITPGQLLAFRRAQPQQPDPSLVNRTIHRISHLTLLAGYLLELPINLTATAIILLQRYLILRRFPIHIDSQNELATISATILSLVTRSSTLASSSNAPDGHTPNHKRNAANLPLHQKIYNIYTYLLSPTSSPLIHINPSANLQKHTHPDLLPPINPSQLPHPFTTPSTLQPSLQTHEPLLLTTLNYTLTACTPHALALTYLSTLSAPAPALTKKVLKNLTTALLSPHLLNLTHQPPALAVSAIYLAAQTERVELVGEGVEWWEVWAVGREELGFLVLSLMSAGVGRAG